MEGIEFIQWLYVAVVAPVLGAVGGWLRGIFLDWRAAKRRNKGLITLLSGLPPESKAVLIHFHDHGAHTLRLDPSDPAVRVLSSAGLMVIGPGGGTYDAVDSYLTIRPDIWQVMDDWIAHDAEAIVRVRARFLEPAE
jgi:hypothetical protein